MSCSAWLNATTFGSVGNLVSPLAAADHFPGALADATWLREALPFGQGLEVVLVCEISPGSFGHQLDSGAQSPSDRPQIAGVLAPARMPHLVTYATSN